MKILHVIPTFAKSDGGPTLALHNMCQGLSQHRVEIHVCTTDGDSQGWRQAVPLNQPVKQYGATVWYFKRQTRFYTASWPLTRWLASQIKDYDLIHIHCLFSYAALPAAFYATRYHVPYIVRPLGTLSRWGMTHRRPLLKRLSFALIEKRILENAALIHYTSEQEQAEASALGVNTPSVVIPHGVELGMFDALPDPQTFRSQYPALDGKYVLLFLGRLHPVKGVELLLTAFRQLQDRYPNSVLVLAGEGARDYVAALRAQVASLGLTDAVVWTGFISGPQKLAALAAADAFVAPSFLESFGMSVVEAMAAGLPIVITDRVSIHHEVRQADAGLVVPCKANAMSTALLRLAHSAELCRQMGVNGRHLAHDRFSLQTMARSLIVMYEEVLQRQKGQ